MRVAVDRAMNVFSLHRSEARSGLLTLRGLLPYQDDGLQGFGEFVEFFFDLLIAVQIPRDFWSQGPFCHGLESFSFADLLQQSVSTIERSSGAGSARGGYGTARRNEERTRNNRQLRRSLLQ